LSHETHFRALHTPERPLFGLTWSELAALALASPVVLWLLVTPLPFLVRTFALVLLFAASLFWLGGAGNPQREALRALPSYLLRPRQFSLQLERGGQVFRA
jgi:hypothetical protein